LEDRRRVGASSYNSGDGTDQGVKSLMFMMMMMMMITAIHMLTSYKGSPKLGVSLYLKKEAAPSSKKCYSIKIRHYTAHSPKKQITSLIINHRHSPIQYDNFSLSVRHILMYLFHLNTRIVQE